MTNRSEETVETETEETLKLPIVVQTFLKLKKMMVISFLGFVNCVNQVHFQENRFWAL